MTSVEIEIDHNRRRFSVGDKVEGFILATLPLDTQLSNITLSFHCIGKVQWSEFPGTHFYRCGHLYKQKCEYYAITSRNSDDPEVEMVPEVCTKRVRIAFSFAIPDNQNLPSSLFCNDGFIKYSVRVGVKEKGETKVWEREVFVQSPFKKHLQCSVGGKAEKNLPLHGGLLSMQASIDRKGYFPGETVTVHILVDNQTNVPVRPQASLQQVQLNKCAARHQLLNTTLSEQPISGAEIGEHSLAEEALSVQIPIGQALSMKSSVISIRYFINITLSVTSHTSELHINLPIVITTQKMITETLARNELMPRLM